MTWINGKKTYIVCAAAIGFAAVQFWNGSVDMNGAAQMILTALGAAGFRSAYANK
jgi:hypothetical protein